MSFKDLKKASSDFSSLVQKLEKDSKGGYSNDDEGYWKLTVDKAGNGYAVIRFLPAPPGEEDPYQILYTHGWKGPTGKWYIENSRTTIGGDDPCGEENSRLWQTEIKANQDIASARKRRKEFIANILVIEDPANKENEGKVFKYSFGPKIFGKIELALKPAFPDEKPFNPFNFWNGANFRLKARVVDEQRNYDSSGFDQPSALFNGDDDALEKLWKELPSLKAVVAPDQFKSYEELQKRLDEVLGKDKQKTETKQVEKDLDKVSDLAKDDKPPFETKQEAEAAPKPPADKPIMDGAAKYQSLLDD